MPRRAMMNMLQSNGETESLRKDAEHTKKNEIKILELKNKITKI